MALQLWKIEIRSRFLLPQPGGVVEEIKTKIKERSRNGLRVHKDMLLNQVPAARPHQQRRDTVIQPVLLAFGASKDDRAVDRVTEVDLTFQIVLPRR